MLRDKLRLSAPIKAVRILPNEGQNTLDAVIQSQRQSTFESGVNAGIKQATAGSVARLDEAVELVNAQHAEALGQLNQVAVELALSIARSILKKEQLLGNYDMERIVRDALHESGVGRNPCTVHLNPIDYDNLKELQWRTGTHLKADEGVAQGDVQVETGIGLLVRDARSAMDTIRRNLLEEAA